MVDMVINAMTDVWNTPGTTYNSIKMSVSYTAGASGSKLLLLQVNGVPQFSVDKDGNVEAAGLIKGVGSFLPSTSGGGSLGSATFPWGHLYLANLGSINWNNGGITATHGATDTLTFAGASLGYQFADGPVRPVTNDSVSIGVPGFGFADVYLASGKSIDWGNGTAVLRHGVGNALEVISGEFHVTTPGTNVTSVATLSATQTLTNKTLTTPTISGPTITTPTITGGTINNAIIGGTTAVAGTFTTLTANTAVAPDTDNGASNGTALLGWSDVYLASTGTIRFGNTDWVATHVLGAPGIVTVGTGELRITTPGDTITTQVVTRGATQTLTGKTLTSPAINTPVINGGTIGATTGGTGRFTTLQVDTSIFPDVDKGATLGTAALGWTHIYLGGLGSIRFNDTAWVATHSAAPDAVTITAGELRITTPGTGTTAVTTNGFAQTLTNKTLTTGTTITGAVINGGSIGATTPGTGDFTTLTANIECRPDADKSATLGTPSIGWTHLYLGSLATIRFNDTDWVATHSLNTLTIGTGELCITTPGNTLATQVVTRGATQTLSAKTLASPVITGAIRVASYTVALLPAGAAGDVAFATNCRVFNGAGVQEGIGVGSGGLVTHNGTAWKIAGTNVNAVA